MISPFFTFLVRKEKAPVAVHTGFIKHHSEPLYAMITNGTVKESKTGIVTSEDVEEDVFLYGVCSYLYCGEYKTPSRKDCKDLAKYAESPPSKKETESTRIVKRSRGEDSNRETLKNIYAISACNCGFHGEKVEEYDFTSLW